MIQHMIGAVIGAAVAWFVLVVTNAQDPAQYTPAVVIGAIATILWPLVIGWLLVRRRKNKRDDQIQKEVDKQIAQQK